MIIALILDPMTSTKKRKRKKKKTHCYSFEIVERLILKRGEKHKGLKKKIYIYSKIDVWDVLD